jgi:hypothetical protein
MSVYGCGAHTLGTTDSRQAVREREPDISGTTCPDWAIIKGKAIRGSLAKQRTVLTVFDWAAEALADWTERVMSRSWRGRRTVVMTAVASGPCYPHPSGSRNIARSHIASETCWLREPPRSPMPPLRCPFLNAGSCSGEASTRRT